MDWNILWEVFLFYLVFRAGYWTREKVAERELDELMSEVEAEEQEIENKRINAIVERHGDQFYLFNEKTGDFVVQGKNLDEIKTGILARYGDKQSVRIDPDQAGKVGLL